MRADMSHVHSTLNCESKRVKRLRKGFMRAQQRQPLTELPQFESMGRQWWRHEDYRFFRGNALRHFLHSSVGRPWNQVYSDICWTFRGKEWEKVKDFLRREVPTNVTLIDGEPWVVHDNVSARSYDFWVHPETGELVEEQHVKRVYKKTSSTFEQVKIDDLHRYVKVNDIWYHVTFERRREICMLRGESKTFWGPQGEKLEVVESNLILGDEAKLLNKLPYEYLVHDDDQGMSFIKVDDQHRYVKFEDVWFEVTVAPKQGWKSDIFLNKSPLFMGAMQAWGDYNLCAIGKRQVNKKEKRMLRLR